MPVNNLVGLEKENFNADQFVKDLVHVCTGSNDLMQRKIEIQKKNEIVAQKLKGAVKDNYLEFINTAREISRMFHLFENQS